LNFDPKENVVLLDPMGDRTLTDLLTEQVQAYGDRTFLIFEDREGTISSLTYRQFDEQVRRCAGGLHGRGVGQGDFVIVNLSNCPEVLITWFALARLGAAMAPSNVANTAGELEHILNVTGALLVVTEPSLLSSVEEALSLAGSPAGVVIVGEDAGGHVPFHSLLESGNDAPEVDVSSNDIAELIFTSGTTRKPKAVMITHANCLRAGLDAVHCLWLDDGEKCLTALPLFHVNAQAMSLFGVMTVAGTLVVLQEFRATKFWNQVRSHGATQTCLVAMQLRTVLAQPPAENERDHRVRRLFFAINVTEAEKDAFEARFGATLINGYGLSEGMTLLTCSPITAPRRWPSIGLPSPGRQLLLLDDDGNEVAPGEVGEIVAVGTPGRDIMLGYYKDPESTASALRPGGRLHTGDNAYADAKGYLYFFDRKKDMIKRAGENVSAIEVEWVVLDHPKVSEAAVIGVPDDIRDEAVAVIVVPVEPGGLTAQELMEYCHTRLSKFKVPTIVSFAEELPRTSIGKVRKDELRKALMARR
jgi:crotonobetaine/carnitine-CoA ligase